MNAYELADKLKLFWHTENDNLFEDTANMLRQQATLIDYYKVRDSSYQRTIAELAKEKENLSDEEIMAMAKDYIHYTEYRLAIQFARAILKKASEK